MDLARHREVLRSHRMLLIAGLGLAIVLAYVATFRLGTLSFRQPANWSSTSTLLVTQTGFPWGRAALPSAAQPNSPLVPLSAANSKTPTFADPSRFTSLAVFYAWLFNSDPVRALIPGHYPPGAIVAAAGTSPGPNGRNNVLPLVVLTTTSTTSDAALRLNDHAVSAFARYLAQQQDGGAVPPNDRVHVGIINPPAEKRSSKPGYKNGLALVILALFGSLAVAYLHDNVSGRRRNENSPPVWAS